MILSREMIIAGSIALLAFVSGPAFASRASDWAPDQVRAKDFSDDSSAYTLTYVEKVSVNHKITISGPALSTVTAMNVYGRAIKDGDMLVWSALISPCSIGGGTFTCSFSVRDDKFGLPYEIVVAKPYSSAPNFATLPHTPGFIVSEALAGECAAGEPDTDGDGLTDDCDPDIDHDGIINDRDNCATTYNHLQEEVECAAPPEDPAEPITVPDRDGDGISDYVDKCPDEAEAEAIDGIHDGCDNSETEADLSDSDTPEVDDRAAPERAVADDGAACALVPGMPASYAAMILIALALTGIATRRMS